jgi:murein DD-endopeptidase MepM/ murein hydrolase activator NlpD
LAGVLPSRLTAVKKTLVFIFLLLIILTAVVYLPQKSMQKRNFAETIKFDRYRKQFIFFKVKSMPFRIPIAEWPLESLLKRSVLYLPADIVRDGLPWFGALRDDWREGKEARYHQGIDIYGDSLVIIAAREGVVERTGRDRFSGGIIKLDHGHHIKTVYIHLSEIFVAPGMQVTDGMPIGQILRPEGNARESQLHFELQVDGVKQDPLNYVRDSYKYAPEITHLLDLYQQQKSQNISKRRQIMGKIK